MQPTLDSYDDVPYPGDPVFDMHPDRLAALGRLHGLATASPAACRLLELGCCDGGNLIPLALNYPRSQFVGVDLSARQIASGRAEVAALGIKNLDLRHASILDISAEWGSFDYLLCHGVYSWVPAEVQSHILAIARDNLTPTGIAYVAYNTYPGWHLSGTLRQILLQATGHESDRRARLRLARQTLDHLRPAFAESPLLPAIEELQTRPDYYLVHEYLEDRNEPLWFAEFHQRAEAVGLRFLCEAKLATMEVSLLPEAARSVVTLAPGLLQREALLDILRQRTFRQSLLCHRDVTVHDRPQPDELRTLWISSDAQFVQGERDGEISFATPDGNGLKTNDPELFTLFIALANITPGALRVADLGGLNDGVISPKVLACVTRGLIDVHVAPVMLFNNNPPERPRVCPWARRQAARGPRVTDLRHRLIELDEVERIVVPRLDGQTTRAGLVAVLEEAISQERLVFTDAGDDRPALEPIVEAVLRNLAKLALLTAASS